MKLLKLTLKILFKIVLVFLFAALLLWSSKGLGILFGVKLFTMDSCIWWAAGWLSCIVFGSALGFWKWSDK